MKYLIRKELLFACFVLGFLCLSPLSTLDGSKKAGLKPDFPEYEKLEFQIRTLAPKAMSAGTVSLTARRFVLLQKQAGSIRLDAKIDTKYFQNNSRRECIFRLPDYRPYEEFFQTFEANPTASGLYFSGDTVFFVKKKPCRFGNKCPITAHWLKGKHIKTNFPKPWLQRQDQRFLRHVKGLEKEGQAHGSLLSLLYELRKNLKPGTHLIRNIAYRGSLFEARADIQEKEELEVPAGNYTALKIKLSARLTFSPYLKSSEKPKPGFLGMEGDLFVWLEAQQGYILKIEGIIPVKAVKINIKTVLELKSRETLK